MKDPLLKEWREYISLHHGVQRFTAGPASVDVLPAYSRWRELQHEREQVRDYLASLRSAHGTIRFLGLPTLQDHQDMRIDRLFVEPQVSAQLLSPEGNPEPWGDRRPLREAVAGDHRLVILGDPGSGKSTLVDWLAWQLADAHQNAWKTLLGSRIPIPLILRDLRLIRGVTWDGLLDAFLAQPIGRHLSRPHLLRNRATLPNGKALLYEDIVQAYLKTIDEFRHITEYTDSLQEMKRWLSEVGFKMQQRLVDLGTQGNWIDGDTLRGCLGEAMAGTGSDAAASDIRQFLDIIKRRSGLVIERGDNQFAFAHRSFQEYFAAVYLAGWVTSAEWLLGEAVPPGTAATDLQRYAADTIWQETLVFLFELLDGATPLGKKKIREAVFGPEWSSVTGESVPSTASLLARLTSNPHVNWDPNTKASALDWCLTVVAEYHDRQYRDTGPGLNIDIISVNTGILHHLLTGESASSLERFQRLVDRWASTGNPRLALLWIPLTDLSLLASLTNLRYLVLMSTPVTDLSPLAG